jgi:hypothetical protein
MPLPNLEFFKRLEPFSMALHFFIAHTQAQAHTYTLQYAINFNFHMSSMVTDLGMFLSCYLTQLGKKTLKTNF